VLPLASPTLPCGVVDHGSVVNTTVSYNANGNQVAGDGLTLTYASFNKPAPITAA
jgi:hypothetical protein